MAGDSFGDIERSGATATFMVRAPEQTGASGRPDP